jgi:hypothetical protein
MSDSHRIRGVRLRDLNYIEMADGGFNLRELEQPAFARSQEHLLKQSVHNPLPTELPPPIAALGGNQGDQHVVVLLGQPEVGKPFLAKRMRQYLRFFHGADVALFDINDHIHAGGVDEGGAALSRQIGQWLLHREDGVAVQPPPSPMLSDGSGEPTVYKGQKAVDSGRCAIVYPSHTANAFEEKWSGSSKERRRWIAEEVKAMAGAVKLIFVEVKVTDRALLCRNIVTKRAARGEPVTTDEDIRRVEASIREFSKLFVTIQQDGSEEDMSYVLFINYGQKLVTNRMHGFLRMRIAQFLST